MTSAHAVPRLPHLIEPGFAGSCRTHSIPLETLMTASVALNPSQPGRALTIALWIAQVLVALVFIAAGFAKLTTPIAELSRTMQWTGQFPEGFVRFIGAVDLAGGLGILLPSLTRILPRLTVAAALGCVVLQVFALTFHLWRGEAMLTPLNIVLLSLSAFVLWGRAVKAPIAPRGAA